MHPLVPKVPPRRARPWSPSLSSRIPAPEPRPGLRLEGPPRPQGAAGRSGWEHPSSVGRQPCAPWRRHLSVIESPEPVSHPKAMCPRGTRRNTEAPGVAPCQEAPRPSGPGLGLRGGFGGGRGHLGFCPGPPNTPSSPHGHVLTPQVLTAPRSPPGNGGLCCVRWAAGAVLRVGDPGGRHMRTGGPLFPGEEATVSEPTLPCRAPSWGKMGATQRGGPYTFFSGNSRSR